jgi:hypothetical protein
VSGHHHAQWLSRRLIDTLITVTLVLFAVGRAIGKTVRRAQAGSLSPRGGGLVAFIAGDLVELAIA